MARKVSYYALSEEEYYGLLDKIEDLEKAIEEDRSCYAAKIRDLRFCVQRERIRFNELWDNINRPAIEESARKGEEEFLDWCSKMAEKYEKLDEEEWTVDRARFYNNGLVNIAENNDLPYECEEVDEFLKYKDLIRLPFEEEKTEGWTETVEPLHYKSVKNSYVLPNAQNDIFDRYFQSPTGWKSAKYHDLYHSFKRMEEECGGWEEFIR